MKLMTTSTGQAKKSTRLTTMLLRLVKSILVLINLISESFILQNMVQITGQYVVFYHSQAMISFLYYHSAHQIQITQIRNLQTQKSLLLMKKLLSLLKRSMQMLSASLTLMVTVQVLLLNTMANGFLCQVTRVLPFILNTSYLS